MTISLKRLWGSSLSDLSGLFSEVGVPKAETDELCIKWVDTLIFGHVDAKLRQGPLDVVTLLYLSEILAELGWFRTNQEC